jgi:hypothetical protein
MFSPSSRISPDRFAPGNQLVQPVDRAKERRLSASRRSDEGGDCPRRDREVEVEQRLRLAVPEVEVLDVDSADGIRSAEAVGAGCTAALIRTVR